MSSTKGTFTDRPKVHPRVYNVTQDGSRGRVPRQQTKCAHKGCNKSFSMSPGQGKIIGIKNFIRAAQGKGWVFDDEADAFFCHDHKPQRETMTTKTETPTITPAMRRSIFRAIDDAYDDKSNRYADGIDDKAIATQVGTTWGWVARIREENFGPAGPDPEIAKMLAEAKTLKSKIGMVEEKALEAAEAAEGLGKQLANLEARLGAFK